MLEGIDPNVIIKLLILELDILKQKITDQDDFSPFFHLFLLILTTNKQTKLKKMMLPMHDFLFRKNKKNVIELQRYLSLGDVNFRRFVV